MCYCVEQILTSEFDEARSFAGAMDLTDRQLYLRMLWSSMKFVEVQETFMKVGIPNHASLSGAYCRFLIKNSKNAEVKSLKGRVKALESEQADL